MPLHTARQLAANSPHFVFPVLDEGKRLVGILAKSGFVRPLPRQLILVDHNELSQAVKGAEELPIIEVLDHHRVGFSTDIPILFWNSPLGSTSTLVALSYEQQGIKMDPAMAGLLMAGLVSDTLNLTSPTTTPVDARVLDDLSRIAGVTPAKLAEEIFAVGSPLRTLPPKAVIVADCKDYHEGDFRFSVSQIEELGFSSFSGKQEGTHQLYSARFALRIAACETLPDAKVQPSQLPKAPKIADADVLALLAKLAAAGISPGSANAYAIARAVRGEIELSSLKKA